MAAGGVPCRATIASYEHNGDSDGLSSAAADLPLLKLKSAGGSPGWEHCREYLMLHDFTQI